MDESSRAQQQLKNALNEARRARDQGDLALAQQRYQQVLENTQLAEPRVAYDAAAELGFVYLLGKRHGPSRAMFERAQGVLPALAPARYGLGLLDALAGSFEPALERFRALLREYPQMGEAAQQLVASKRFERADDADVVLIEQALARAGNQGRAREKLSFALAKALDDCGEWSRAFGFAQQANRLKKARSAPFDPELGAAYFRRIARVFDAAALPAPSPRLAPAHAMPLPVFIVGMPRSGTTLLEQMLCAHPQVNTAGEQAIVDQATLGALQPYPESCVPLSEERLAPLREQYGGMLKAYASAKPGTRVVLDKYPMNFLHLGLVRQLLPEAVFVHSYRHPADTCLSIYFQDFRSGNLYANDLHDLAGTYRAYCELMQHWHRMMPGQILDCAYETLVADRQAVLRAVLAHCGLPFDSACLTHTRNAGMVDTLSRWQVRQPVYTRAVARWRHYESMIGPLAELAGVSPAKRDIHA